MLNQEFLKDVNNKGIELYNQGKLKEAIECFDEILKLDPKAVYAWNGKGNALKGQGKLKEAIECFDDALKLDPKDVNAWNNKGFALYNQGKLKEAIECFDEALKFDPKFVHAWNNKGFALQKQGKLKEAIECYDEILKLDPENVNALNVNAWNNKGFALKDQGKLKEAIECFDKALKLDPKYVNALNNKGFALDNQGKLKEAIELLEIQNSIRLLDAPPSSSLQFSPIYGIAEIKVTSLMEAIKPLAPNLVKYIDKYTQDALKLFSKNPLPTPLDLDETVAIHLYTKEWPEHTCSLYYVLNAQLRSEDRCKIQPFYPYIKILLMGLNKLEKTPGVTYRGVGLNLSKDYNIGEEIEWWAFTSTTTEANACQGFLKKSPEKTVFRLEQKNGVNIQKFSQYPSESEVLLCPMKVLVKNNFKLAEGLWMVELEDLGISLVNLHN